MLEGFCRNDISKPTMLPSEKFLWIVLGKCKSLFVYKLISQLHMTKRLIQKSLLFTRWHHTDLRTKCWTLKWLINLISFKSLFWDILVRSSKPRNTVQKFTSHSQLYHRINKFKLKHTKLIRRVEVILRL